MTAPRHRRIRARSTRARGRSALPIALAVAVAGIALAFVLLRSGRDEGPTEPLRPSATSPSAPPTDAPGGAVRTSAPQKPPDPAPAPPDAGIRGWHIAGLVTARGGGPVPGARMHLFLEVSGESRAIGEPTTAGDGSYVLPAPALDEIDPLAASLCRVTATVEAEHKSPARAVVAFDPRMPGRLLRLDVRLEEGELLAGRIVEKDGAEPHPVPQATVRLSVAQVKAGVTTFVPVQEQTTDASGRFALGFTSSGRYHVAARADGVGTAFVEDLDLEAGSGRDLGDLVLAGSGPIAGTVRHEDGAPAAHFELWAFEGEYAASPDGMALAVRKAAEDERGDGLRVTRTTTDAEGRFALKGLRKGSYALRSPDARAVLEPRQARYEPPMQDVQLQLLSYGLVVRVVDEEQKPVRGANVRLTALSMRIDGTWEPAGSRVATAQGADATATFSVDPEAHYALDAYTSTRRSREELVVLTQHEFSRESVIVLPRRPPTGRIRLDVRGEDGRPLTKLQVAVLSPVTGARREDIGVLEPDDAGLLPPLPCDPYDLLVGYAPGEDRFHFPVRTSAPVNVVAGDPVLVSLSPRRGGRVSLALVLDGPPPRGYEDAPPAGALESVRAKFEESRRARFGCTVVAERKRDGVKRNLQIESRGAIGARLMPGETATAWDLLEPDAYTITIVSPTPWQFAPDSVNVVAGQAASAKITLRAR